MRWSGEMEDVVFRPERVGHALDDDPLAGLELRRVSDEDLALS
jgi:hypothetical protein